MELTKPKTIRSKHYEKYIKSLGYCQICGASDESILTWHHIEGNGTGIKCNDTRTISICFKCHNLIEQKGKSYVAEKFYVNYEGDVAYNLMIYLLKHNEIAFKLYVLNDIEDIPKNNIIRLESLLLKLEAL